MNGSESSSAIVDFPLLYLHKSVVSGYATSGPSHATCNNRIENDCKGEKRRFARFQSPHDADDYRVAFFQRKEIDVSRLDLKAMFGQPLGRRGSNVVKTRR